MLSLAVSCVTNVKHVFAIAEHHQVACILFAPEIHRNAPRDFNRMEMRQQQLLIYVRVDIYTAHGCNGEFECTGMMSNVLNDAKVMK